VAPRRAAQEAKGRRAAPQAHVEVGQQVLVRDDVRHGAGGGGGGGGKRRLRGGERGKRGGGGDGTRGAQRHARVRPRRVVARRRLPAAAR
jgi:hypothetical protein